MCVLTSTHLRTLSVTQLQKYLQCRPVFLPALSDAAAGWPKLPERLREGVRFVFLWQPVLVFHLSQLVIVQRFHVGSTRSGFVLLQVHRTRRPAEARMGQQPSVPEDMDQTVEVLSAASGRALCLSVRPSVCFSVGGSLVNGQIQHLEMLPDSCLFFSHSKFFN